MFDALIYFLRFLRFLRNDLSEKTLNGSRWLEQAKDAPAGSKSRSKLLSLCSTQRHNGALQQIPPYYSREGNLCAGDPVSHHQSLRAECARTTASCSCARSVIRARRSQCGVLNWRFVLTQMTAWWIEVAPVPGLSNVASPTKPIITIPITLYGYGNGDAEEGSPEGCAMGGSMGSTSATKSDAGGKLRVPTSSRTSPAARLEIPIPRYLDEPA